MAVTTDWLGVRSILTDGGIPAVAASSVPTENSTIRLPVGQPPSTDLWAETRSVTFQARLVQSRPSPMMNLVALALGVRPLPTDQREHLTLDRVEQIVDQAGRRKGQRDDHRQDDCGDEEEGNAKPVGATVLACCSGGCPFAALAARLGLTPGQVSADPLT